MNTLRPEVARASQYRWCRVRGARGQCSRNTFQLAEPLEPPQSRQKYMRRPSIMISSREWRSAFAVSMRWVSLPAAHLGALYLGGQHLRDPWAAVRHARHARLPARGATVQACSMVKASEGSALALGPGRAVGGHAAKISPRTLRMFVASRHAAPAAARRARPASSSSCCHLTRGVVA